MKTKQCVFRITAAVLQFQVGIIASHQFNNNDNQAIGEIA